VRPAPDQAVLATVRLVGDQEVTVTAQHAGTTDAAVALRVGRALLYLNDEASAAHFHKVWFDAAEHARALPVAANRDLVRALRGMPEPGIVANAIARPACSMAMVAPDSPPSRPFLRIQLGRVAFEVRDFAAYRSCLGAFRQAHHVARDVFLPPGTERVLSDALTIARDAFYPEPPTPRPSRVRQATQTTRRSAPITPAPTRTAAPATTAEAQDNKLAR
jgi:hypothetical protein